LGKRKCSCNLSFIFGFVNVCVSMRVIVLSNQRKISFGEFHANFLCICFFTEFHFVKIVSTVAKLNIPDLLKDGPKSTAEIAQKLGKPNLARVERLLRAAAAVGVFHRDPQTLAFSLNDLSKELLNDANRAMALWFGSTEFTSSWDLLDQSLDGTYAFKNLHGTSLFDYLVKNPSIQEIFNKAMTSHSAKWDVGSLFSKAYDLSSVKTIVDVGGGQGLFATQLLRAHPHLKAVVLDLPATVKDVKPEPDVASRLSFSAGSFFEQVPEGGDVYFMKTVSHNWNDEDLVKMLQTVRKSMSNTSKFVTIDFVPKEVGDAFGSLMDLIMVLLCDAQERTEAEFAAVFARAGLRLTRFSPLLPSPLYFVEAEKI